MAGPRIRSDIIDVYVFRRPPRAAGAALGVQFLQLRRTRQPLSGTWQPIMGHADEGETAVQTALRELAEEAGYAPGRGLLGLWQLEELNSFFLASIDCIMLSPCFAAEVDPAVEPVLNEEHDAHRWVARDQADCAFLWSGQRRAIENLCRDILLSRLPESPIAPHLRVALGE